MPNGSAGEQAIRGFTQGITGGVGLGLQIQEQRAKVDARLEAVRAKTKAQALEAEKTRWSQGSDLINKHLNFAKTIKNPATRQNYLNNAFSAGQFAEDEDLQSFVSSIQSMPTEDQDIMGKMAGDINKAIKTGDSDSLATLLFQFEALNEQNEWGMDSFIDDASTALGVARKPKEEKAPTVAGLQAKILSDVISGTKRVEDLSEVEHGLVNKAIATGGMSLSVDPDTGAISFTQGSGGLTKPSQAKAEQTFTSGQGLLGVIDDFRDIMRPENIGLVGDIRETVQGMAQQGGALAARLSGMGDDIAQRISQEGDNINSSRWFDPNLAQMDFLGNIIAYKHAKTLDPSGRLSDRDIMEAKKSLGLERKLVGIKDIATVLNALEKVTIRTMTNANARLGGRFTDPVSRAERVTKPTGAVTPEDEAAQFLQGF